MYGGMESNGSQGDWGQHTPRHHPSSSHQDNYGRSRLEPSQSGYVPPLLPPPLPPISSVASLPSAFLEFSRRLYNSTIADLGMENPVDLFADTSSPSSSFPQQGDVSMSFQSESGFQAQNRGRNYQTSFGGERNQPVNFGGRGRGFASNFGNRKRDYRSNFGDQDSEYYNNFIDSRQDSHFNAGGSKRGKLDIVQSRRFNEEQPNNRGWNTFDANFENKMNWSAGQRTRQGNLSQMRGRGKSRGGSNRMFVPVEEPVGPGNKGGGFQPKAKGTGYGGHERAQRGRGRGGVGLQRGGMRKGPGKNMGEQNTSNLSVAEKIRKFCAYLKQEPPRINAIQTIENGLTCSKLNLTANYHVEELFRPLSASKFSACFSLGGHFIARALGPSKKELKHEVYRQAMDILSTKSVVHILCLVDPGVEGLLIKEGEDLGESTSLIAASKPEATGVSDETEDDAEPIVKQLTTLVTYLHDNPVTAENSISAVELSISMSHCNLKSQFTCVERTQSSGRRVFKGILCIGGIAIAEGHGMNKRDAKHDSYTNALAALKTRSVEALMSGENVEGHLEDGCWEETEFPSVVDRSTTKINLVKGGLDKFRGAGLAQKMVGLTSTLKDAPSMWGSVHNIDCLAVQLGLTPVCYYKKILSAGDSKALIRCELYINDIFIALGDAKVKKDAQIEAYKEAFVLLTTCPSHQIINQQPRREESDPAGSDIIEKVVKGAGRLGDSNLDQLKGQLDTEMHSPDSIVIVENTAWIADRERNAFSILCQSASMSGLLLEWTFHSELYNECTVTLQKTVSARAVCNSKMSARNKACAEILNSLYMTRPVIQISRAEDQNTRLPWEKLKQESVSWSIPDGYMEDVVLQDQPVVKPDGTQVTFNEKAVKYVTYLMEERLTQETLECLVLGPGIPSQERKAISKQAARLNLKMDMRLVGGRVNHMVVSKNLSVSEMVDILRKCEGKSGKYILLSGEEPPYIDIKPSLALGSPSPNISKKAIVPHKPQVQRGGKRNLSKPLSHVKKPKQLINNRNELKDGIFQMKTTKQTVWGCSKRGTGGKGKHVKPKFQGKGKEAQNTTSRGQMSSTIKYSMTYTDRADFYGDPGLTYESFTHYQDYIPEGQDFTSDQVYDNLSGGNMIDDQHQLQGGHGQHSVMETHSFSTHHGTQAEEVSAYQSGLMTSRYQPF